MKYNAADLHCLTPDSFELPATGSGVLDGLSFVLKDMIAIEGHISSFGSSRWRETHTESKSSSPILTRLLNAGARMAGLATLDQLAGSLYGFLGEGKQPLNPLYNDCIPGGSSSGSASAVAGGIADFAIGTDTGGSVRVPSACCGVYGIRPSHGNITSEGVLPWAPSFDVVGIMARDAQILQRVYQVLASSPDSAPKITKLLVVRDIFPLVSAETANALVAFTQQLAAARNLSVEEIVSRELIAEDIVLLIWQIMSREIWRENGTWIKANRQYLIEDFRRRTMLSEHIYEASTSEWIQEDNDKRAEFRELVNSLLDPGTALIIPTLQHLPPKLHAKFDRSNPFWQVTFLLNSISGLSGVPQVVVPIQNQGATWGIGIISAANSDARLLELIN